MVRLQVFGIFHVHTDTDACDCTQGLCGHRNCKGVCTGRKIPRCTRDSNPCQYYAWLFSWTLLPADLSLPILGCTSRPQAETTTTTAKTQNKHSTNLQLISKQKHVGVSAFSANACLRETQPAAVFTIKVTKLGDSHV